MQEKENTLTYSALESLGVSRNDIKDKDVEALLLGQKTNMMKFSIPDTAERRSLLDKEKVDYSIKDGNINFDGKVMLQKHQVIEDNQENRKILGKENISFEELKGNKLKVDDASIRKLAIGLMVLISPVTAVALMLLPKRTEIKNEYALSKSDIKELKTGGAVLQKGEKGNHIVQLDADTNSLVRVRVNDIKIPNKIAGQELSLMQKEQLKNGNEIKITDARGEVINAKIDLNEKSGISLKDDRQNLIKQEVKAEAIMEERKFSNDKEKLEFVAKEGIKGVEGIQDQNVFNEAFKEKYNLKQHFDEIKDAKHSYQWSDAHNSTQVYSERMEKIDSNIKTTASSELSSLTLKNESSRSMKI